MASSSPGASCASSGHSPLLRSFTDGFRVSDGSHAPSSGSGCSSSTSSRCGSKRSPSEASNRAPKALFFSCWTVQFFQASSRCFGLSGRGQRASRTSQRPRRPPHPAALKCQPLRLMSTLSKRACSARVRTPTHHVQTLDSVSAPLVLLCKLNLVCIVSPTASYTYSVDCFSGRQYLVLYLILTFSIQFSLHMHGLKAHQNSPITHFFHSSPAWFEAPTKIRTSPTSYTYSLSDLSESVTGSV